jgi:Winged helix-turn helix
MVVLGAHHGQAVLVAERVRVREIDDEEGQRLPRIIRRGTGLVAAWRRAQVVLLSAQGMPVAQIAEATLTSADRVREMIHNFNADGFDSLYPKHSGGRPKRFTLSERREIKNVGVHTAKMVFLFTPRHREIVHRGGRAGPAGRTSTDARSERHRVLHRSVQEVWVGDAPLSFPIRAPVPDGMGEDARHDAAESGRPATTVPFRASVNKPGRRPAA